MIDIIIPAYNTHETIMSTLFSILNQTALDKIKVYLIDDFSDKNYNKEYNFFKNKMNINLIRLKENNGPGVARQIGINNSNSEYLLFLDSDDVLYDSFSIENALKLTNDKPDLIISAMIEKYEGEFLMYYGGFDSLHSKLYKRSFIENNNIYFPNTYNSEDIAFNNLFLLNDPKISFCEEIVYAYRRRKNSLTMTDDYYSSKHIKFFCKNLIWTIEKAIKDEICNENIAKIISNSFAYLYYYFTIKSSMEDKTICYVSDLVPYYEKYKKYIDKKEHQKNLEKWYSIRGIFQFDLSFNQFIMSCKKNSKKVIK